MPVYALFLVVFFALPALALGWLLRTEIRRYGRTLLWCMIFVYSFGAVWDWLSVRTGVWRYDSAPTLGVWIDGLPIEEFLGFYIFGTLLIAGIALYALKRSNDV